MDGKSHPWLLNEQRGNPHNTRQVAASPKHYTQVQRNTPATYSKLKLKTKHIEARSPWPRTSPINAVGLEYFVVITALSLLRLVTVEKILHSKIYLKISSKCSESLVQTEMENKKTKQNKKEKILRHTNAKTMDF